MPKSRLDISLVARGLAPSRTLAQRLVMAGQVRVDGEIVLKPATSIPDTARLEIDQAPPYVSRGGEKLAAALGAFRLDVSGCFCADVGASTGGFTDCLLQHGAARVYAIDVGKGILHWKLRQDSRVVVMEGTNARFVKMLQEPVHIVTIDASFISLRILLPVVKGWFHPLESGLHSDQKLGNVLALVKPQFEAGRREVARGEGVIRDPAIHRRVLESILDFASSERFVLSGVIRSPLLGPKGNVEYLVWLKYPGLPNEHPVESDWAARLFSQPPNSETSLINK